MADERFMFIKLLVDKKMNKVMFAECNNDFVDVLFSFLTIPIGTIIRSWKQNSNLGCMDALYGSIEALEEDCFQTDACKEMLLKPKSSSEFICKNLAVNVDGDANSVYYLCDNWFCTANGHGLASLFNNVKCLCGRNMTRIVNFVEDKGEGVFVKGCDNKFLVSDDLNVTLVDGKTILAVGTQEAMAFEERTVAVGLKEVLDLLKGSLFSTKPLTDIFLLNEKETLHVRKFEQLDTTTQSSQVRGNSKRIKLTLWRSKSKNKVLFAEGNGDFINLLFSFLVFPLGFIVKFLGKSFPLGIMSNLYQSVEELCTYYPENVTEDKDRLLNPQIPHHFGWENQLIKSEEASWSVDHLKCITCFSIGWNYCSHGLGHTELHLINPKSSGPVTTHGGGFVHESMLFMVSDDLAVAHFSWRLCGSTVQNLGTPYMDIELCTVYMGEEEARRILEASFTSKTALTDVFCRK